MGERRMRATFFFFFFKWERLFSNQCPRMANIIPWSDETGAQPGWWGLCLLSQPASKHKCMQFEILIRVPCAGDIWRHTDSWASRFTNRPGFWSHSWQKQSSLLVRWVLACLASALPTSPRFCSPAFRQRVDTTGLGTTATIQSESQEQMEMIFF